MSIGLGETMATVSQVDPYSRNLGRGKACDACRRRKLRCDGARPSCNRCIEAQTRKLDGMRRKGKSEEEITAIRFPPCYTETSDDHGAGADSQPATLQAAAASSSTGRSSVEPLTPEDRRPSKLQRVAAGPAADKSNATVKQQSTTQNDLFFAEILSSHLPLESSSRAASNDPFGQSSTSNAADGLMGRSIQASRSAGLTLAPGDSLSTACWLRDTDVDLPPQPLLSRLVDVFFEEHMPAFIFHPSRLRERIALGPQHPNYPQVAALHIIVSLAYAARPDIDEEVTGEKPTARSGAHYRHLAAAQHGLTFVIHTDCKVNTLDLVRTSLLSALKTYGQGDQLESYLASAQAARLCISVNMNRDVPSRAEQQMQQLQYLLMQPRITDASIIRPEPSDEIEAEEVRRTMLLMFAVDRTSLAATLWPGALVEEDYTAEMPRATFEEFITTTTSNVNAQAWPQRRNTLSLQSHDFFSRRALDAEQFFFKVTILLGRCAHYVSRLSRTATPDQIVSAARFQQLESWIATQHLESYDVASMAAKSSPPTSGMNGINAPSSAAWASRKSEGSLAAYLMASSRSDIRKGMIVTASMVPYACTLTLHEPLANLSQESEARCKAGTRGAIGVLRLCAMHAEEEMQRLDIVMTIVVMLVGRSLIRQLESLYSNYIAQEMAQQNGDNGAGSDSVWNSDEFNESVSLLQADLEVILLTLKRFGEKWQMAVKMHDSLLKLLQFNPEHRLRGLFCVE